MDNKKESYYIRQWVSQLNSYVYLIMIWPSAAEWTTQEAHPRVSFNNKEHAETIIKNNNFDKAEAFADIEDRLIATNNSIEVRLIKTDDWEAIIVNNELIAEGHRFSSGEILEIMAEYKVFSYVYEDHYEDDEETFSKILNQYKKDELE